MDCEWNCIPSYQIAEYGAWMMLDEIARIERDDTLADKAYERLRMALMAGNFRPGDSLSIRQLAGILGISATPARDAISRVLWERGLQSGPHRTVVVPRLDADALREIYDVRLNLEGLAAGMAATRFTKADVKDLERAYAAHVKAVDARDYRGALAANEVFHFQIYDRCDNATLVELIRGLWLRLGPSLNLLYPKYDLTRQGVGHHTEIAEAIKQGNAKRARKAVEDDLKDGWTELARALGHAADAASPAL